MGVAISEKSYPSIYQNVTEGKLNFFEKKLLKSSVIYYLEPGLYPCITDIVEAMNIFIQERHNHSEMGLKVKVSRRAQKDGIYLPNEKSGQEFFSTDLGRICGSNVGDDFGVMLRGKGPHKPVFAHDIVHIDCFKIYTDLIEYNIFGDSRVLLLRCFFFIAKISGYYNYRQYLNYHTFGNLQIRPLLKNLFHSIHNDLRDTSDEKIPFVSVGITRVVLMFKKASNIHF